MSLPRTPSARNPTPRRGPQRAPKPLVDDRRGRQIGTRLGSGGGREKAVSGPRDGSTAWSSCVVGAITTFRSISLVFTYWERRTIYRIIRRLSEDGPEAKLQQTPCCGSRRLARRRAVLPEKHGMKKRTLQWIAGALGSFFLAAVAEV